MNDTDLDTSYSHLCRALGQAGPAQTPLFLSMLCLSLIARLERADQALPLIDQALRQCDPERPDAP